MMQNVFHNKNFVLVFLGALVSNIGSLFYSFAVGYWILDITNNNAVIQGIYLGACGLTFVLFSLFGGVLSDRFNKVKIIYICDYLKAILIALSSFIILFSNNNLTVNLIVLFSMGIISNIIAAMFSPAAHSILPLIVEKDQLQQANSYKSVLSSVQAILGLVLAGLLYSLLKITTLFFIIAICYLLSAISEMFIKYEYKPNENKLTLKSVFNDIKEGFQYINTKKALSTLLIIIIFINFFFSPIINNFISFFIKTDIATNPNYLFHSFINPEMWGAIFSIAVSISSIIFGIILSMRTIGKDAGKMIKIWLLAVGILTLFLSVSYFIFVDKKDLLNLFLIIFIVFAFILGMILSFINIPINTVIQTITDKDKLGKVSSITELFSQGLIPLSSFIAGFVISYLGSSTLLFVCSVGFLVVAVCALVNKSINNFE